MDLFDYMRQERQKAEAPLAARLRPSTLDEVVGQEHIIGEGRMLRRAIQADKLSSVIFYGPPGTGKTTLAKVIANTTSAEFVQLNATTSGKKDMEEAVNGAKDRMGMYGKKTILFIDEIHRFNKSQQDYLLPFVEDGTVTLIGATTENPYFEVNGALLSRSLVFELKPLSKENIKLLLYRAVSDVERGMGSFHAVLTEEAADFLCVISLCIGNVVPTNDDNAFQIKMRIQLSADLLHSGCDGLDALQHGEAVLLDRFQALGIHADGCPIYTLTSEIRHSFNAPDDSYLSLITKALIEENGFTENEANLYLAMCLNN